MSDEQQFTLWQRVLIEAIRVVVIGAIGCLGLTMMYWLGKLMFWVGCK